LRINLDGYPREFSGQVGFPAKYERVPVLVKHQACIRTLLYGSRIFFMGKLEAGKKEFPLKKNIRIIRTKKYIQVFNNSLKLITSVKSEDGYFFSEATRVKKVFCVEDNEEIALLLQYQLEKLGYILCGVADNTPDAMAGIGESKPDIVLVDIGLNGKPEGLEIGNFLVSETDIPFIYVSGQDNPEILENARKTFPGGYLMKPFGRHELKVALDMAQHKSEA
jgi:CheY-like chemotaxis protein